MIDWLAALAIAILLIWTIGAIALWRENSLYFPMDAREKLLTLFWLPIFAGTAIAERLRRFRPRKGRK